jgi:hypothetical protein
MVSVEELNAFPTDRIKNPRARICGTRWCHLTADTIEELEAMARRLNLNPKWIQDAKEVSVHYDLVPSKRSQAIKLGAVERSGREWARAILAKLAAPLADVDRLVVVVERAD